MMEKIYEENTPLNSVVLSKECMELKAIHVHIDKYSMYTY